MSKISTIGLLLFLAGAVCAQEIPAGAVSISRLHYEGGGDWYTDPSSLPNLLDYFHSVTQVSVNPIERRVKIGDDQFYESPYLYMTGHGNINFTDEQAQILRDQLINGAFLHADDCYGMDESFRREMGKVFPEKELVELPADHEIFHMLYDFPNGLPKVHEHDGKRPQALGIFYEDRLVVLYTYETDLGDGWEDAEVHHDPAEIRMQALEMGTNILLYALSH
ncbi:MAG: DUF4159 domain-containing protein [FCB group bacterium]|nr:DUF4159 domain-containing protein [FCB group bacterium]